MQGVNECMCLLVTVLLHVESVSPTDVKLQNLSSSRGCISSTCVCD